MSPALCSLSHSKYHQLNQLFRSRLRLVLFTLVLQILIIIPLSRSFLFVVGIFNLPAILALIMSTFKRMMVNYQTQKTIKTLLKVGIAKAIGGVLLAAYIGLKYALMLHEMANGNRPTMRVCVIYLTASALVDILYSVFAFMAIKRTKEITQILRKTACCSKDSYAYTMASTSSHGSGFNSTSCSEEESSEKGPQATI